MKRLHINVIARVLGAGFVACALVPVAAADLQGWNGAGWYVTGSAPLAATSPATPAFILFNGPYASGSECTLVYDRLYSPIGVCRLLDIKPGT
jgi:hypothetical protein